MKTLTIIFDGELVEVRPLAREQLTPPMTKQAHRINAHFAMELIRQMPDESQRELSRLMDASRPEKVVAWVIASTLLAISALIAIAAYTLLA